MARPRITLMAFVSNSFAMRAVPPIGCGSQPTGDLLPHIPPSGGSGGEKGGAGAARDRARLPGAEATRQGERAEQLVDGAGVVVRLAEEPLAPPVAGEEQ